MKTIVVKDYDSVRLRQKGLKDGRTSLYLDFYERGKRKYEFLSLYLLPGNNNADKVKNRQTMQLAEAIRYKRSVEMKERKFGVSTATPSEILFYPYFESLVARRDKHSTKASWQYVLKLLKEYDKDENLTLAGVTRPWVRGFKDFLDKHGNAHTGEPLGEGSKYLYYSIFKVALNQAVRDEYITTNPTVAVGGYRMPETNRMYLTLDEVRKLSQTPCKRTRIKEAFLFSCLTGLRFSDIKNMTWGDVYEQGKYTRIIYRQQKTSLREYLDISPQAVELMGERGASDEHVFQIRNRCSLNGILARWCKAAGIEKHITFHCARHTFATMMLELGTDIYTVSKLLGHRNIATTQIYTKVMDSSKQAAIDAIPKII